VNFKVQVLQCPNETLNSNAVGWLEADKSQAAVAMTFNVTWWTNDVYCISVARGCYQIFTFFFCPMPGSFHINMNFSVSVAIRRIFSRIFLYKHL
jgi:hypothetical protein